MTNEERVAYSRGRPRVFAALMKVRARSICRAVGVNATDTILAQITPILEVVDENARLDVCNTMGPSGVRCP